MEQSVADRNDTGQGEDVDVDHFKAPGVAPVLALKKKTVVVAKEFLECETGKANALHNKKQEQDTNADNKSSQLNSTVNKEQSHKSGKIKSSSPAELLKENESVIPYKEPSWGGVSDGPYYFEVIKTGAMVDLVELTPKSYHIFGRLPSCDHSMDHPSLSRYHAVIQHCAAADVADKQIGWYLYDLDSTHGTWINKKKVTPHIYHRLRVGYVVKFGGSTRLYILQGPDVDQDAESELSVTELKQQRERQKKELQVIQNIETAEAEERIRRKLRAEQDVGCTWGFADDADASDSDDEASTVSAIPMQEELYIDDPKKALRGFFEREGWELPEYEFADEARGKHTCRVEIPIDTPSGQPIIAEVTQTGSRKDAVVACALEACRILDRHGLLRKATHESRARKEKNWEENDFYDSDEDAFLDRTGDIEKKRQKRILKAKPFEKKPDNFETLSKKLAEVQSELSSIEERLQQDKIDKEAMEDEGLDALDAFMQSIKSGGMDSGTRMHLKRRAVELRQERTHLERLTQIAKPCQLPTVQTNVENKPTTVVTKISAKVKQNLPLVGKIKTAAVAKPVPQDEIVASRPTDENVEEEEEEEGNEDDNSKPHEAQQQVDAASSMDAGHPSAFASTTSCDKLQLTEKQSTRTDHQRRKRKLEKAPPAVDSVEYCDNDPDYAVWVPPQGQSGDGRTHLNDKFGY